MDDEARLKIVLYTIVVISIVVIIGAWEMFIRPLFFWLFRLLTA